MLHVISHIYTKIEVHSDDSLPLEKTIAFHNVIILMKPVFNKNENTYCYNIFLEKLELPNQLVN